MENENNRMAKEPLKWEPEGTRRRGRGRTTWIRLMKKDSGGRGSDTDERHRMAVAGISPCCPGRRSGLRKVVVRAEAADRGESLNIILFYDFPHLDKLHKCNLI